MIDRPRQDSSRDLLEELEEGWATPRAHQVAPAVERAVAKAPVTNPPPNPELDAVDSGWLDDLFPGGEDDQNEEEEEEEDDEEEDEPEAPLPDERLDPEAYAAANKAREERAAKKKERRRNKSEAKRAKQKARAAASKQKQKLKKPRATSSRGESEPSLSQDRTADTSGGPATVRDTDDPPVARARTPQAKAGALPRRASTKQSIKLLAIVLALLVALAAVAAAILK